MSRNDSKMGPILRGLAQGMGPRSVVGSDKVGVVAIGEQPLVRLLGRHFQVEAMGQATCCGVFTATLSEILKLLRERSLMHVECDQRVVYRFTPIARSLSPSKPQNEDVYRKLKIGRCAELTGQGVRIAIQDTGFTDHCFIENDQIVARETMCSDADTDDNFGHGTAIVSQWLGRSPVPGLVPLAQVMSLKIFDRDGSTSLSSILMANEAVLQYRARILNLSYGGPVPHEILRLSYRKLYREGVVLLAAAGNEGPAPSSMGFPARYEEVIAVGATDKDGRLCTFSSRGVRGEYGPDVAAYGEALKMARLGDFNGISHRRRMLRGEWNVVCMSGGGRLCSDVTGSVTKLVA